MPPPSGVTTQDVARLRQLVAILSGRREALPTADTDWHALLIEARRQHVGALLTCVCADLEVQPPAAVAAAWAPLQRDRARTIKRVLLFEAAMRDLAAAIHRSGHAPPIALKGLHLAATVYPPGARPMADLDVLVRQEDISAAVAAAASIGFTPIGGPVPDTHHITPMRRGPVVLELHWLPMPTMLPGEPDLADDLPRLHQRAVLFPLLGGSCLGLAREDLLLHVATHTTLHHLFEHRLRGVWDIARLVDTGRDDIDWALVADRADRWGVSRGVALALATLEALGGPTLRPDARQHLHLDEVPAAVRAAAVAQLLRPRAPVAMSPYLTRALDPQVPIATRARLVLSRAFLDGAPDSTPQAPWRRWRRRLTRPFQLVRDYATRWRRISPEARRAVLSGTDSRHVLTRWLGGGVD